MKPEQQRALARVAIADGSGLWMSEWSDDPALEELEARGLVWGGARPRLTPRGRNEAERLPKGFSVER